MFHKFGKLVDLKLKIPRGGNPFCFLEFESAKGKSSKINIISQYLRCNDGHLPYNMKSSCANIFLDFLDAEDALRRRNNYVVAGSKIRVEYPTGMTLERME